MFFRCLTVAVLFISQVLGELASAKDLQLMKEAEWVNEDEVALSVNFHEYTRDPYPKNFKGYNVDIDYSKDCYVVFQDQDKSKYKMIESSTEPEGEFGVFKSHTGPCGVCSNLKDLAVYIETPDLTTPVTRCAKMLIPARKKKCLRDLGFSERCMYIWYFNTIYTAKGCFNICIRYQNKPRNQPEGNYNPCKPISDVLPSPEEDPDIESPEMIDASKETLPGIVVPPPMDNMPSERTLANLQQSDKLKTSGKSVTKSKKVKRSKSFLSRVRPSFGEDKTIFNILKKKKNIGCRNSINRQPACQEWQWKNNPQRLNPCIQCDECKSGPMFQFVSGRQRRNSGVRSGIDRPGVAVLDHHYYTAETDPLREDL